MDYIREELLRQRAVLARLLLGRSSEDTEREEERMVETGEDVEDVTLQAADREFFRGSRALAVGERFRRSGKMAQMANEEYWEVSGALLEELPEKLPLRKSEEDRKWLGARLHNGADMVSGVRYVLSGRDAVRHRQEKAEMKGIHPGLDVLVEERGVSAGDETADARELSRVFQRDARRYDGGFTLY